MALRDNLVAYYKLDESSGSAYSSVGTHTLTNTGTTPYVVGKLWSCIDFWSSNTTKELRLTGDNLWIDGWSISMSAWVNVNTAPASNVYQFFVSQGSATSKAGYELWYHNAAWTLKVGFWRDPFWGALTGPEPTYTLTIGTWFHLVLTYDWTNVEWFINGVSQGKVANSGNGSYGGSIDAFGIGGYCEFALNQTASAKVDEVGVWNRAITQNEILEIYNAGRGFTFPFLDSSLKGSLKGYWPLDGHSLDFSETDSTITFWSATWNSTAWNATSYTRSFTVWSWSNRIVFVWAMNCNNTTDNITSVTCWWVSMTRIATSTPTWRFLALYALHNPPSWAVDFVTSTSSSVQIDMSIWDYSWAKQSSNSWDFITYQTTQASWSNLALTLSTLWTNQYVTSVSRYDSATSAWTNTTQRLSQASYTWVYDSTLNQISIPTPVTVNITWTAWVASWWIVIAFSPAKIKYKNNWTVTWAVPAPSKNSLIPASLSYQFNGSSDYITVPNITWVKSVSFWTNPTAASQSYFQWLTTSYIKDIGGGVDPIGFISPTVYVNGEKSSLNNGLVSYWRMEWNSTDEFWINNWTDTSVTYWTSTWKNDQWAWFNWTSSKIVKTSVTWLPVGSSKRTVAMWYYQTTNDKFPFVYWDASWTGTAYAVYIGNGAIWIAGNAADFYWSGSTSLNNWHHFASTFDWSTTKIYVDWVLKNSGAQSINTASTSTLYIWSGWTFSATFWPWNLDEVWVWNRDLTADEISLLYNGWSWLPFPLSKQLKTNSWNHVVVTSPVAIDTSTSYIGRQNSSYLSGKMQDVALFSNTLTQKEVRQIYGQVKVKSASWLWNLITAVRTSDLFQFFFK